MMTPDQTARMRQTQIVGEAKTLMQATSRLQLPGSRQFTADVEGLLVWAARITGHLEELLALAREMQS